MLRDRRRRGAGKLTTPERRAALRRALRPLAIAALLVASVLALVVLMVWLLPRR
jgi:hypothetical protein